MIVRAMCIFTIRSNRTFMELKRVKHELQFLHTLGSNRTFMELKLSVFLYIIT